MMPRPSWLALALAAALSSPGLAADLKLSAPPERLAAPGDYVTLPLTINGTGEVALTVTAPDGWAVLTPSRSINLEGEDIAAVTVRVASKARANEAGAITFRATQGGKDVAEARAIVRVKAMAGVALQVPQEPSAVLGEVASFEFFITNSGNARDTFRLSSTAGTWEASVSPASVTLEPWATAKGLLTLAPPRDGSFGKQHRQSMTVAAASANQPAVVARSVVVAHLVDPRAMALIAGNKNLRMTLSVSAGVAAGVVVQGESVSTQLSYNVKPALTGDLSDYAKGAVTTTSFSGDLDDPFRAPRGVSMAVEAETWSGGLTLGAGNYSAGANFKAGQWRLGAAAGVNTYEDGEASRLRLSAISDLPGLDLQVSGQIGAQNSGSGGGHGESLLLRYRAPLGSGLMVGANADLSGASTPSGDYAFSAGLGQSLSLVTQNFELLESYGGVPQAGLHTIGLAGGTRSLAPVGLRANTSVRITGEDTTWTSNAAGFVSFGPNLRLRLDASYLTGNRNTTAIKWTAGPTLSLSFGTPGGLRGLMTASYQHRSVQQGPEADLDMYAFSVSSTLGILQLGGSASLAHFGPTSTTSEHDEVTAKARMALNFTAGSAITAEYGYSLVAAAGREEAHTVRVGWDQFWSRSFSTRLEYAREFDVDGSTPGNEQAGLTLRNLNTFASGLQLSVGYTVARAGGFFVSSEPLTHTFSVSLGYAFDLPFDTPAAVTSIFGGRRTGEYHGVAFLDEDLDSVRDANEKPLAGLTVQLGTERVVTDASGKYVIRAPLGQYEWRFPAGLPATVELFGEETAVVELNQVREHNLAFAEVTNLDLLVVDDLNHDGKMTTGEPGIAYAGVRLDGPVKRVARADAAGTVSVSGLVRGTYTISPDPTALPERYEAVGAPLTLLLDPSRQAGRIVLVAAEKARSVTVTFAQQDIAVLAKITRPSLPPGSDARVVAYVQGKPTRVTATLLGKSVPLQERDGEWVGSLTIPGSAAAGRILLTVVAEGADARGEYTLPVQVAPGADLLCRVVSAMPGQTANVSVETLFRASSGEYLLPDGRRFPLSTSDGYAWKGTWTAGEAPGSVEVKLIFDGRERGIVKFDVVKK